jgi:hypothetical protein
VSIDDAEAALRHEAEHEIAPDESGAAGDQDRFHPQKVFIQGKASKCLAARRVGARSGTPHSLPRRPAPAKIVPMGESTVGLAQIGGKALVWHAGTMASDRQNRFTIEA